ncbi:MAG: class E sortase [Acidimicrobiia bacterium]
MDRLRSALSVIGATLTGTGVLILLFVAYQLWGTGLYEAQAQDDLRAQFDAKLAAPTTTTTTGPDPVTAPPPAPTGEAVALIRIPKIGLDRHVVEGTGLADLRKAPGHYPSTPLPGVVGNAAIAGHRTTYGAPFNRLDELEPGDEILVTTVAGSYTFEVEEKRVVNPSQVEVLAPSPVAKLTLTTCHPKYSAKQRLVVISTLAEGQQAAPAPPPSDEPPEAEAPDALADAGLGSGRSKVPTVLWGLSTTAVGVAWWLAVRRRRHWTTYLAGVLPFLAVLFVFYANLEQLLPANF